MHADKTVSISAKINLLLGQIIIEKIYKVSQASAEADLVIHTGYMRCAPACLNYWNAIEFGPLLVASLGIFRYFIST